MMRDDRDWTGDFSPSMAAIRAVRRRETRRQFWMRVLLAFLLCLGGIGMVVTSMMTLGWH